MTYQESDGRNVSRLKGVSMINQAQPITPGKT